VLDRMPLTSHGKVDRRALPVPEGRVEEVGEYVAPQTEIERVLAGIWAQILRVDQIGTRDNFFELGGHSLLGMRLITKISEQLGITLPVSALFKYPTIEQMATAIAGQTELESGVI